MRVAPPERAVTVPDRDGLDRLGNRLQVLCDDVRRMQSAPAPRSRVPLLFGEVTDAILQLTELQRDYQDCFAQLAEQIAVAVAHCQAKHKKLWEAVAGCPEVERHCALEALGDEDGGD